MAEAATARDVRTIHDIAGAIKAFEAGFISAALTIASIKRLLGSERVFHDEQQRANDHQNPQG